ncbi:MAG TPA: SURF1 family protein [Pseudomonadales bacterium]
MRAHFNWKLALFVVLMLPVLLRLGFWQLQRADQKQQILDSINEQVRQPPVDLLQLADGDYRNYRNVYAKATLLPQYALLDNQIHRGRFGYEVIQAARLADGRLMWVSRGWQAGDPARRVLPAITTPVAEQTLSGYLYRPTEAVQLAENPLAPQWPQRIQAIELEKLYKALDKTAKIAPLFLLRLDPQSPAALTPHWQLVNVEPAKHSAYAMQWFGMALLLVVLFTIASLRRQRHDKVPCNE